MRDTFEYAVLRVVPRVERGESLNAGVLVYCRPRDYLGVRVHLDVDRLRALDPTADADAIGRALQAAADLAAEADSPFGLIREHVLLPFAGSVADADGRLAGRAREAVDAACAVVPPDWVRGDYAGFLHGRLAGPRAWVAEADDARP